MIETTTCDVVKLDTISDRALHEAGHGVAAFRYGIGVRRVSLDECEIEPPGDFLEQGRHHGSLAVAYAVIALAGHAAAPKTGLSKSDELLLEYAFFLGSWSHHRDELRRAFSVLAEDFVHSHLEEIEAVAIVLEERRSLPGDEVVEIFGSMGQ